MQHCLSGAHLTRSSATIIKICSKRLLEIPDSVRIYDAQRNERLAAPTINFGWKLYIDNPLADCEAPQYVPNSMRLTLSDATTPEGTSLSNCDGALETS